MKLLKVLVVGTWTHIVTIHPGTANQPHQIAVACLILRKHHQVPATLVLLNLTQSLIATTCHIHLTSENRFERLQAFFLTLTVYLRAIVEKILYAEHIAMIRNSHSPHPVRDSLIHETRDAGLSVQQ